VERITFPLGKFLDGKGFVPYAYSSFMNFRITQLKYFFVVEGIESRSGEKTRFGGVDASKRFYIVGVVELS
jgi:hypothetical protein